MNAVEFVSTPMNFFDWNASSRVRGGPAAPLRSEDQGLARPQAMPSSNAANLRSSNDLTSVRLPDSFPSARDFCSGSFSTDGRCLCDVRCPPDRYRIEKPLKCREGRSTGIITPATWERRKWRSNPGQKSGRPGDPRQDEQRRQEQEDRDAVGEHGRGHEQHQEAADRQRSAVYGHS